MRFNDLSLPVLINAFTLTTLIVAAPKDQRQYSSSSYHPNEASSNVAEPSHPVPASTGNYDMSAGSSQHEGFHQMNDYWNHYTQPYPYHPDFNPAMHQYPYAGTEQHGYDFGSHLPHQGHHGEEIGLDLQLGHGVGSSYPHQQFQNTDLDLNLRLGPGPSSSHSHEVPHQNIIETNVSPPSVEHTPRPEKLSQYDWQVPLTAEQVLEIYRSVASKWPPTNKKGMRSSLERLNVYLLHYPEYVEEILSHQESAIKHVAYKSLPTYTKNSERKKVEKIESVDNLLNWVCATSSFSVVDNERAPWWAPQDMDAEARYNLVELLHRAWMKDRDSVKASLNRMGPDVINQWAPSILEEPPKEAWATAIQWEDWWGKRVDQAQSERSRKLWAERRAQKNQQQDD